MKGRKERRCHLPRRGRKEMPGIVSTEAESRTGRARGAGKSKHPAPDGVKGLEQRVTGLWKGQAALLRVVRVVGMERVWGEGEPK